MSHISGKRAATSPLNSEFYKRPKIGLSDKELRALNEALEDSRHIPISGPEDVKLRHLGQAFREVALQTSNIDQTWRDSTVCKEFADRLSPQERLDFILLWIEAREKGWAMFANYCALLPSHRSATAALCSLTSG
jgi:hypothetical protein